MTCAGLEVARGWREELSVIVRQEALRRSIVPQHRHGGATLILQPADEALDVVYLLSPLRQGESKHS